MPLAASGSDPDFGPTMKKALAIPALLVIATLVYMVRNHADYGEALPPSFPPDIAIVAGEIISGRRALFEDGRGYVVDIRTDLSNRQVVEFYGDRYGEDGFRETPGMGGDFSVGDIRVGGKRVLLEIHSRDAWTYVTMAVHLGEWL